MEEGVPTIEVPDTQVDAADLTQVYSDSMVNGGKPAAMKEAVEPEKIQDTCDESVFQDAQPRDSQIVPGDASEGVEDAEAEEASEKMRRLEAFVDESVETAISHCKKKKKKMRLGSGDAVRHRSWHERDLVSILQLFVHNASASHEVAS